MENCFSPACMVKSISYLGSWSGGEAELVGESFRHYGTVAIDNEFEVRWQDADGGPQIRKLTLPAKFAEEKRSRLVIQINPGGEVQVSAIRRR